MRTSVTGQPSAASTPCSSCCRTPFSTDPTYWVGTAPPTTFDSKVTPEPRGSGEISMSHTAYWPCPPDCLTCRPCPLAVEVNVLWSATRTGSVSSDAPARNRSSTASACDSPRHHSTSCPVEAFR